jgi:uncharacterized membrane protein YkvI
MVRGFSYPVEKTFGPRPENGVQKVLGRAGVFDKIACRPERGSFMSGVTFRRYVMPGLVFQGVLIGGGYGTGREIVEYFMRFGPLGGLIGMFAVTLPVWAIILAVTFEFARAFETYDYRSLLVNLLGRFWLSFELFYVTLMVVVLAVVGSAAGVLLRDFFGVPYLVGVVTMLGAVGFLTFKVSGLIEKSFSVWSILIYAVYLSFLVVSIVRFGDDISANLGTGEALPGWALGSFKYGLYNMCVVPAILFCVRHIETRRQAISAGLIAAVIGILPAFFFYIAILGQYPDVVMQEIPAVHVLEQAQVPALLVVFVIMLFGTLIQTGTGFIHGVNERIQRTLAARGKEFPDWQRPVIAIALLVLSLGLAKFGIIALVARGYGLMSWGIFVIYFVPLVTVGLYKIIRQNYG